MAQTNPPTNRRGCSVTQPEHVPTHPERQVRLVVEVQEEELALVAGRVHPGLHLRERVHEGALLEDGDGGEGGVAAHSLGVPVDGVPQQLGHDVQRAHQRVEAAVEAAAVRDAQRVLCTLTMGLRVRASQLVNSRLSNVLNLQISSCNELQIDVFLAQIRQNLMNKCAKFANLDLIRKSTHSAL